MAGAAEVSSAGSTVPAPGTAAAQAGQMVPQAGAGSLKNLPSSTQITDLESLQAMDPTLYKYMVEAIQQNMLIDFGQREKRVEEAMKKLGEEDPNQ